jgi:hypothetical protein
MGGFIDMRRRWSGKALTKMIKCDMVATKHIIRLE